MQRTPFTWSKRVEGRTGTEQKGYLKKATYLQINAASAQETSRTFTFTHGSIIIIIMFI